jgi:hypothetical protein
MRPSQIGQWLFVVNSLGFLGVRSGGGDNMGKGSNIPFARLTGSAMTLNVH